MRLALIVIALIWALAVVALDFGFIDVNGDPNLAGWIAASLAAFYASHLTK